MDRSDDDHVLAQIGNEELLAAGHIFLTTNFILDETLTLICYHMSHQAAVDFWYRLQQLIQDGLVEFVRVDEADEAAAWQIFEQYADQDFSFTDRTSFAVMRNLALSQVFTADRHFSILGFTLVP